MSKAFLLLFIGLLTISSLNSCQKVDQRLNKKIQGNYIGEITYGGVYFADYDLEVFAIGSELFFDNFPGISGDVQIELKGKDIIVTEKLSEIGYFSAGLGSYPGYVDPSYYFQNKVIAQGKYDPKWEKINFNFIVYKSIDYGPFEYSIDGEASLEKRYY